MPDPSTARTDAPPPWLPAGEVVHVPGRGEFFVRRHVHPDSAAPTVLLLHGWTASADLQFIAAYRALDEHYSFIAIDHRGHGRGFRSTAEFDLADVADDAAAVTRHLGVKSVIAVGYSMGGPIALHLTRRHPQLVGGIVVQATALEWSATLRERLTWRLLPFLGVALRSWTQPRLLRRAVDNLIADGSPYAAYREWMTAEMMRNEPRVMVQAGKALSRYDAREWASSLGVPAAMLLSTEDRLVRPRKQRELARALNAHVIEVPMDHLGALDLPDQFASATVELVSSVVAALDPASAAVNDSN
ncbi:alpha/beta fold hydrolase [Ilumatobacter nonamiensis]|uniref:alpha/beta fold hydrolase n=1 Tax=Ilumatobacter nonamiensis TaxID=467093 RepID=UPI00058BFD3E|nr:alpha/beta hydrolase [Ilumatobacter nonamiensis]